MAINETAELERLIPSYELALCTIAGRLNDNNKYAMEAVLIGSHPSGKGVTAAIVAMHAGERPTHCRKHPTAPIKTR